MPDFDGICSGDILVFESSSTDLLPGFLPYAVQSDGFFNHALGTSAGSLSPRTKWSDLARYEFALPPLDEQARIVEVLQQAEELAERLHDAKLLATRARESLIATRLDAAHDVPLGALLRSCEYGLSLASDPTGDIPILRMNNLNGEDLVFGDLRWVRAAPSLEPYFVRPGDILVNRTNSAELVGKVALVESLPQPMVYASYLLRLRVDSDRGLPEYVTGFLQSAEGRRRLTAFVTKGVSQANINASNLKRVLVPIPSLEVQRQCVVAWRACRELQTSLASHHALTRRIGQLLREEMMGGRVVQ